jgi:hypothetical protein
MLGDASLITLLLHSERLHSEFQLFSFAVGTGVGYQSWIATSRRAKNSPKKAALRVIPRQKQHH